MVYSYHYRPKRNKNLDYAKRLIEPVQFPYRRILP